jgi:hypothetical protein
MTESDARMILGVGPDATLEECWRGYRNAVRRWESQPATEGDYARRRVGEAWDFMQQHFEVAQHATQDLGVTQEAQEPVTTPPTLEAPARSLGPTRSRSATSEWFRDPVVVVRKPARAYSAKAWAMWFAIAAGIVTVLAFGGRALSEQSPSSQNSTVDSSWVASEDATEAVQQPPSSVCGEAPDVMSDAGRFLVRFKGRATDGSYAGIRADLRTLGLWFDDCLRQNPDSSFAERAKRLVALSESAIPAEPPSRWEQTSCTVVPTDSDIELFNFCMANPSSFFNRKVYDDVPSDRVAKVNEFGRRLILLARKTRNS